METTKDFTICQLSYSIHEQYQHKRIPNKAEKKLDEVHPCLIINYEIKIGSNKYKTTDCYFVSGLL